MNNFYITLPSNSSFQYFENNTLTKYTTKLQIPIQLEGKYEVAITDIFYLFNWSYKPQSSFTLKTFKDKVEKTKDTFVIKNTKFENIHELIDALNNFLQRKNHSLIKFTYSSNSNKVQVNTPIDYVMEFTGDLNKDLGFKHSKIEGSMAKPIYESSSAIKAKFNQITNLFVYTDIIEHQYVGDKLAPLLRVVAVKNSAEFGDYIECSFNEPHYLPVCRNNIDTILIDIRTNTGEPVHFGFGTVIVMLHFRQKTFF